jgi:hypothetical protein
LRGTTRGERIRRWIAVNICRTYWLPSSKLEDAVDAVLKHGDNSAARVENDDYWQALIDIVGWENWQNQTWREIAQKALDKHAKAAESSSADE